MSPATRLKPAHTTAKLLLSYTKIPPSFPEPDGWFIPEYLSWLMQFPSVNVDLSNHSASIILWKGGIKSFISYTKVSCGQHFPSYFKKLTEKSSICVKGRWVEEKKGGVSILLETQTLLKMVWFNVSAKHWTCSCMMVVLLCLVILSGVFS